MRYHAGKTHARKLLQGDVRRDRTDIGAARLTRLRTRKGQKTAAVIDSEFTHQAHVARLIVGPGMPRRGSPSNAPDGRVSLPPPEKRGIIPDKTAVF